MSKQITAVEWFKQQLDNLDFEIPFRIYTQAKALEKQQHEKTWFDSTMQFANESEMINKKYFDDYYTETFNQ